MKVTMNFIYVRMSATHAIDVNNDMLIAVACFSWG